MREKNGTTGRAAAGGERVRLGGGRGRVGGGGAVVGRAVPGGRVLPARVARGPRAARAGAGAAAAAAARARAAPRRHHPRHHREPLTTSHYLSCSLRIGASVSVIAVDSRLYIIVILILIIKS